ncbi:MAG TPA: flagellar motor protein PomA [Rhizobiales bacterium]|nr:chemotaxis protein PomA [bacterium BMS3Bbin10]HDO52831.1 flagellar motor protein PomA [Hyphomicrobiales bacterium]
MDIATIAGILAGSIVVGFAIMTGGDVGTFVNLPSMLIVIGGGFAATVIRFPLKNVFQALALGGKVAFTHKSTDPREMIDKIAELADKVRREGPLALDNLEIDDPFLKKGAQFVADGYDPAFIQESLELERDQNLARLDEGQRIYKAIGDAAPAFGMIGTIVGLVQMLSNMEDPSTIGPAMAVALLTTLYGALIANLIALPLSDKLSTKGKIVDVAQTLTIDGVMQLSAGKNPNLIREMLVAYLPEKTRLQMATAEAAAT